MSSNRFNQACKEAKKEALYCSAISGSANTVGSVATGNIGNAGPIVAMSTIGGAVYGGAYGFANGFFNRSRSENELTYGRLAAPAMGATVGYLMMQCLTSVPVSSMASSATIGTGALIITLGVLLSKLMEAPEQNIFNNPSV